MGRRVLLFCLPISHKKDARRIWVKDLNSTVAKRGSLFIGLMTPDGAIWSRYQRAVLMR